MRSPRIVRSFLFISARSMSNSWPTKGDYICAEGLGDLHSERTDTSRRAVNQNLLSWLNLSLVAKTLQCSDCRNRYRRRLLKGQVRRFQHHCSFRTNSDVLGERPGSPPEHLVAWFEFRYVFANRFNRSRVVNA